MVASSPPAIAGSAKVRTLFAFLRFLTWITSNLNHGQDTRAITWGPADGKPCSTGAFEKEKCRRSAEHV